LTTKLEPDEVRAEANLLPVGPDPLRTWSMLSPTKRDVLARVALSEMANLISDGNMRQEVRTAGLKLVKQAAS
jgi:hypothetical protein